MYTYGANPTLTSCTFRGNSADRSGGMVNSNSSPTLANCTFSGNTATGDEARGGARCNYYFSSPALTNCTFSGNWSNYHGGGMFNSESGPTLTNCTFCANTAANGSSIACDSYEQSRPSTVEILNGIVFSGQDEIWNNDGSTITAIYSCIQGGWAGTGNIAGDPLFVATGYWDDNDTPDDSEDDFWVDGDYRLLPGSPCIDAGDPDFVPEPGETDLDGHARVLCDRVDMGAYEFGIGDHDCSQVVDLFDFAEWEYCFTGPHSGPYDPDPLYPPECEAFDFEFDGDVDLDDFAAFQQQFTGSP